MDQHMSNLLTELEHVQSVLPADPWTADIDDPDETYAQWTGKFYVPDGQGDGGGSAFWLPDATPEQARALAVLRNALPELLEMLREQK
jgi:hypothetical protein